MQKALFWFLLLSLAPVLTYAQVPTIQEKTSGMKSFSGYFPFYWDAKAGKIWLEIDKFDTEFLYVHSLPAGLGSNDVGLDRNQLGRTRIVKFFRVGPRVLLIQPPSSVATERPTD